MEYYSDYYFTSNVTKYACSPHDNTPEHKCEPPQACAREPTTAKWYCCDYEDENCWASSSTCTDTSDDYRCSGRTAHWCCNYELSVSTSFLSFQSLHSMNPNQISIQYRETCTSEDKQINICWSKGQSPLHNISSKTLNDTYSSLSAASPAATSWSFNPQSLVPATSTPSPTAAPATSAALSGGAIAGIVVGVVAGVAIVLGLAAYMLKRHRKRQDSAPALPDSTLAPGPPPQPYPAELAHEPKEQPYEADGREVQELPASHQ